MAEMQQQGKVPPQLQQSQQQQKKWQQWQNKWSKPNEQQTIKPVDKTAKAKKWAPPQQNKKIKAVNEGPPGGNWTSKLAGSVSKWAKKSSKWGSKWGKNKGQSSGGGGGAASWGRSPAEKVALNDLNNKLKGGDLPGIITAAKKVVGFGAGGAQYLAKEMPKILEMAAKNSGPSQYGEVLAICTQLDIKMDVWTFTKLLVILTSRVPVPTGMVRLTLNLALPTDGQVVPLVPQDATEEDEKAIFEDGEPLTAGDRRGGGGSLGSPFAALPKELGPRPQVKDEQEVQEARITMSKVKPDALRGCVDARDAAMRAYFGHFTALLHLETLVELRQMKRRLQRPQEELERFGWMIPNLTVKTAETRSIGKAKGGQLPGRETGTKRARVVFIIPSGYDMSRLRFRSGDSVLLSRKDPMEDLLAEGIVADAPNIEDDGAPAAHSRSNWEERIVVTFDAAFEEASAKRGTWRLDKAANRTAYERQMMSLLKMATAKDEKRLAIWDLLPLTGVGGSNVDAWASKMQEMLNEKQKASLEGTGGAAALGASSCKGGKGGAWKAGVSPAEKRLQTLAAEEPPMPNPKALPQVRQRLLQGKVQELNPSQRQAVAASLGRRLSLIQGPPGTGKTTVSVQLLGSWAKDLRMRPLLATSDSNIAVDNIAEGVQALGLKVVRVGRPEKVTSHLEDITLESILRQRTEEKMEKEGGSSSSAGDMKGGKGKGGKGSFGGSWQEREEAKKRRVDEFEAKMAILKEADVICTTTIAAGSDFLHLLRFQAILIDEVAQATELSAIVPIALRGSERLVLVGDHCQLPPSICSLEAETRGLSLSIFGRLAAQGVDPYFLDTQFRMHPMIAQFSAQEFYHGRLKTGIDPSIRPPPQGFDWPQTGSGIAFLHVDSPERRDGDSRTNLGEASALADLLTKILTVQELSVLEVGVVSPYSAQVRALRQLLRRELPQRLRGTGVDLTGGLPGKSGARALEIASVDAFQGREKELIIFSAVRSNRQGSVGFLADWRRLNVMITRARRGLIIIGNTKTLRSDPTWGRWLEWADSEGLVLDGQQCISKMGARQPAQAGPMPVQAGPVPTSVARVRDVADDHRGRQMGDERRGGQMGDDRRQAQTAPRPSSNASSSQSGAGRYGAGRGMDAAGMQMGARLMMESASVQMGNGRMGATSVQMSAGMGAGQPMGAGLHMGAGLQNEADLTGMFAQNSAALAGALASPGGLMGFPATGAVHSSTSGAVAGGMMGSGWPTADPWAGNLPGTAAQSSQAFYNFYGGGQAGGFEAGGGHSELDAAEANAAAARAAAYAWWQ